MRTKADLEKFVTEMRDALRYPGAKALYFPTGAEERKKGNIRFAREFGHGLKDFSPKDVNKILGGLYGMFIVSNSFDATGVQIDNKTFITHLNLPLHSEGSPPAGGS